MQFVKYVRLGEPDECWPWIAGRDENNYGVVSRNGRTRYAHREVYKFFNGPISSTKVVRHTCDNPPCCNPAHLIDGSQADNVNDSIERGRRSSLGEDNPKARLTASEATGIRDAFSHGESYQSLAQRYNVSISTIHDITKFRTWRHI